ncbi:MAG TPA: FtsX-like permease family protein [Acetivibrio sp.]|uniref:ABC transporter permease n=1 Tax=Acetivibrio sp. TaxID=1872092 RepID=UPI002BB522D7|nr:FtsX-like permease family protein [Acetivibrio sp.]HOM02999.1 FtsX-like permease family protein [Acetivibrio sp.]
MRMVTRIALANAKYNKSKNILTGIAVFLTTLLLFLVPTVGYDMIESQFAVINEMYPNWHALFRNVAEEKAEKLAVHHSVARWGLRGDAGYIAAGDADISMIYLDAEGFDMYHMKLIEGRLPEAENEIVVSKGILEELSKSGQIGDTVKIPYQVYRDGGLDFIEEKDFVICGFIADTDTNTQQKKYSAFISKSFLKNEIPPAQISYRFLFQVATEDTATTREIESRVNKLAEQFGISEQSVLINKDFLMANYVDLTYVPGIIIIMLIIVAAGVITIYSIYYVSMGERVQEFGKIKAIGATQTQLRKIVLLEGLTVAGIAIPSGLLAGTVLTKYVFLGMFELYQDENQRLATMKELISGGKVQLYHLWIYLLAIGVALVTVYLSLLRPMRVASKVSEIEAIRYREGQYLKNGKKERKGYRDITVGRLAKIYLTGNKRKSSITICSMAITGVFFMVVATILSCANPTEGANNSILGEYEISPVVEFNNKEHPELEWSEVQKNNPLSDQLKEQILQIDGISKVECYKSTYVSSETFGGEREWVIGIPKSGKEQIESGIVEGNITYDDLTSGDKVIIDKKLLRWYPELRIGDILDVVVEDGNGTHRRHLEIAAIGDYPRSFTNYCFLIMAQEGIETFSNNNLNFYYHIFADEKYNEGVESKLMAVIEKAGGIEMRAWKDVYEQYKSNMAMTSGVCYAFLGILGAICIMNMINTMIYSVHVRKKEIGMLKAVGMSDVQLYKMLQLEGLFYTFGTLIVAVGGGSLAGFPVFLWVKEKGIFSISNYHYPKEAAITVILVLIIVQFILTLLIGKSMKKESLIDRIRFSN